MIGLTLISLVLDFVNTFYAMRLSEGFGADLREKAYTNIQSFSFANLNKLQSSELLFRLTSDINIIKSSLMMMTQILFRAPLMLVGSLIMPDFRWGDQQRGHTHRSEDPESSAQAEGRTSFLIAHRLSTIRNADQILVIDEGELVERGDHETLLEKKGFYYNLYNSQFKGLEIIV